MVKVLFFATLKEKAGARQAEFEIEPGTSIANLKQLVIEKFPKLEGMLGHCVVTINHTFSPDENEIPLDAEVAFFPPVSGGSQ